MIMRESVCDDNSIFSLINHQIPDFPGLEIVIFFIFPTISRFPDPVGTLITLLW